MLPSLLSIPHMRRIRFASKGLAVAPGRILDKEDAWTSTLIDLSNLGRQMGKQVCLHTHFNHPNEITWITHDAANYLFKHSVIVRNQSVLLKGVNDDLETMGNLIKALADINIQPVSSFPPGSPLRTAFDSVGIHVPPYFHLFRFGLDLTINSTTSTNATWCAASKICEHLYGQSSTSTKPFEAPSRVS